MRTSAPPPPLAAPPRTTPPAAPAVRRVAGRPAWLAPVAVGLAGAAAVATIAVVDPNEAGHYPTCPFLAVTGLWCPGCGTLRAVHALVRGDLATAVDLNVLAVVLLPVLAVAWVGWLGFRLGRRPAPPRMPTWAGFAVAAAVPAFWVLRNLPFAAALAP